MIGCPLASTLIFYVVTNAAVFYAVHEVVRFTIARGLVSLPMEWSWSHELWSGVANPVLGVFLYALLDRVKQRT